MPDYIKRSRNRIRYWNDFGPEGKKSRLYKSFQFGYVFHCKAPWGVEFVYRNSISDIDNVEDLVTKFNDVILEKSGTVVHREDQKLRFDFREVYVKMEIQPHLANILGFTNVCCGFTCNGTK